MKIQYNGKELEYKGIECVVVYLDDLDGYEEVFIQFGDEQIETDSEFELFYHLEMQDVISLLKACETHRDKFSINKEWFIDLTEPYGIVS